ncbi:MAG: hypothetical protein WDW36_002997 [Sanguina aurantia]
MQRAGVLPGTYSLVWRLRLERPSIRSDTVIRASCSATRPFPNTLPPATPAAPTPATQPAPAAAPLPPPELCAWTCGQRDWRTLATQERERWFDLPTGAFTVPPATFADIDVSFVNHSPDWKTGVSWDWVKLVRDGEAGVRPAAAAAGAPVAGAAGASCTTM